MTDSTTRGQALLDLLPANIDELIRYVKLSGRLSCSSHALVEFTIMMDMDQVKNRVRTPSFKSALSVAEGINGWDPPGTALRYKGAVQNWQPFKDIFHRAQELSITMYKKKGKQETNMTKDLLIKLKYKRNAHFYRNTG